MARSLLVVPAAGGVGLERTSLRLVRALDRLGVSVGFVKPVAESKAEGGSDRPATLVAAVSALPHQEPVSAAELEALLD